MESRGEQAVILRVGTFREIDCWVRFFSPLRGIETGFAFGGRRSRRRFTGCLDSLNHVRLDLEAPRSGRYLTLSQGTLVHRFAGLHRDMQRMGMAVNCIKFLEGAHTGADQAEPVFDLLLAALDVLNAAPDVPATFPLLFRAKLACTYGYAPEVNLCGVCGVSLSSMESGSFSWRGGYALCAGCRKRAEAGVMDNLDLSRLGLFLSGSPEEWARTGRPKPGDSNLWQVLDFFVQHHTGLQWTRGRFRRV
jgi:DNA repair protein RecO (recombination protein O)